MTSFSLFRLLKQASLLPMLLLTAVLQERGCKVLLDEGDSHAMEALEKRRAIAQLIRSRQTAPPREAAAQGLERT